MFNDDKTDPKCFKHKILPVTYCAPRIFPQNPAKPMIPIDQGGGGIPSLSQIEIAPQPRHPLRPTNRKQNFRARNPQALRGFPPWNSVPSVVKFVAVDRSLDRNRLC